MPHIYRDSESLFHVDKIKELNEILLKQSVDLANYEELNKEMAEKNKVFISNRLLKMYVSTFFF